MKSLACRAAHAVASPPTLFDVGYIVAFDKSPAFLRLRSTIKALANVEAHAPPASVRFHIVSDRNGHSGKVGDALCGYIGGATR